MLRSEDHVTEEQIKPNIVLTLTYRNQRRVKYLQMSDPH